MTSGFLLTFLLFGCSDNDFEMLEDEVYTSASDDGQSVLKSVSRPWGINPGWADAAAVGFNDAFLSVDAQGNTYYKVAMNTSLRDQMWTAALDLLAMQDVYERTKSDYHRQLINDLTNGFLTHNPPPYDWDGWNDDIAWMGLASIRSHYITGHQQFVDHARYCFDFVWHRGWDTEYNGGGIWEQQPDMTPAGGEIIKEALSNNPTGRLAALIYQSTGDQWYLDRAHEIYNWSWHNLFDVNTGHVFRGVYPDGAIHYATAVYNQGSFVAFADLMHQITGNANYLRDARRAVDYTINNLTVNGILVHNDPNADTWGDEMARGLGMLCTHNPELWDVYGGWMVQNANAIWNNRRTDYNLTWNGWDQQTPSDDGTKVTKYISALAWLQYTPVSGSDIVSGATYSIISKSSGKAMDVAGGSTEEGANVLQWNNYNTGNQRWVINSVGGNAYSIINVNSGMSLDLEGGGVDNGANILQWGWHGGDNQRWYLQPDGQGFYTIISVASGRAIDVEANSTADGANLLQWDLHGNDNQKWSLVQ